MSEEIVIPLDGSEFAEQALATATELATWTGAALHLVRVMDTRAITRRCDSGSLRDEERDLERVRETADACDDLDRVRGNLDRAGLTVTSACKSGLTVEELAESTGSGDVIVIATHAGANRLDQGSVAWDLIGVAPVPVLTVRPAPAPPDAVARAAGMTERGRGSPRPDALGC